MDDSFNDLNQTEYNPQGSDPQGYNPQGYNPQESTPQGYNPQGYNPQESDLQGYNPQGYNPQGSEPQGYNPQGYNTQGYNPQGSEPQGYNPQGYYQPGYDQSGYGYSNYNQGYSSAPEQKSSNTKAVISLILGIAGLVLCCCLGAPSVILGIIGVILAILSKNDNQGQMDGMAIAGLVLSILAFVVGLASLCFYIYCFVTDPEMFESVRIISNQLLNGYLLS